MLDFSKYESIPVITRSAISQYVENRYLPGSFLVAVLSNDLFKAWLLADNDNWANLDTLLKFIYHELPTNCYGSPERVHNWCDPIAHENAIRAISGDYDNSLDGC